MYRQKASQLILILLLGLLTCAFNTRLAQASTLIYIRANGDVDPPTAPIQRNFNIYTLTDNIQGSIIVEKDNIVINGANHALQGTGIETGIDLSGRTNVTIQNLIIKNFDSGIYLYFSNQITILKSTISDNSRGMWLRYSSHNGIFQNNITANMLEGIYIFSSSDNNIFGNNITANTFDGIYLYSSSNNNISLNNIINNGYGISPYFSLNNKIFHNNFISNIYQVNPNMPTDIWDNGYPSGGNYWSDYNGIDEKSGPNQDISGSDGIGDTPYTIDENNQDRYPLMTTHNIEVQNLKTSKTIVGQGYNVTINVTIINYGANHETLAVTSFANSTQIETKEITLATISSTTLTFAWNTSGFAKGNYTINIYAWPVQDETHTADNSLTDGWVIVAMVGDITGPDGWPDGRCDMSDIYPAAKLFGIKYPDPKYDPNYDLNSDQRIDMADLYIICKQFGQKDP